MGSNRDRPSALFVDREARTASSQLSAAELIFSLRKSCVYLLKRLIDTCKASATPVHLEVFQWEPRAAAELEKLWNGWFLLYETAEDFALHLVQDSWRQVLTLLASPRMHPSWVGIVCHRFLRHDNAAVKKFTMARVLQLEDEHLARLDVRLVLGV